MTSRDTKSPETEPALSTAAQALAAAGDAEQARDGFTRGIYPDDRPKPELLRALTPFEALCGVRPVRHTLTLLDELGLGERDLFCRLAELGAEAVVRAVYGGQIDDTERRSIVGACRESRHPTAMLIVDLADRHPDDPSVVVALLLNHVSLRPGEAIRLDAGTVHAYLRGAGIELMGASDNVVRAGLTSKTVDVDELLRIADLGELHDPRLPTAQRHELPEVGVCLVRVESGEYHVASGHELAIGLDGSAWHLAPGEAFEATAESYVVTPHEATPNSDAR